MPVRKDIRFAAHKDAETSAILLRPPDAAALLVLAHGAGAGMTHPFMESLANELAAARVATFRFQFLYMEHGRKVPTVLRSLRPLFKSPSTPLQRQLQTCRSSREESRWAGE